MKIIPWELEHEKIEYAATEVKGQQPVFKASLGLMWFRSKHIKQTLKTFLD